jgi:hypothetical protein
VKAERVGKAITLGALGLALIHLAFPNLAVDAVTVTFLVIAIVPWLAPLFKSFELPGGWKVEFRDLQDATKRADKAGLLAEPSHLISQKHYSFQVIADIDPNLALAGLRIELEKRLVQLAEQHGIGTRKQGLGRLINELDKKQALSSEQISVLSDMLTLLNSAVHAEKLDNERASMWALDVGPRLIEGLELKLHQGQ